MSDDKQLNRSEIVSVIRAAARAASFLQNLLLLPFAVDNTQTGEYKVEDGDNPNYWMSFSNRALEGSVQGSSVVVDDHVTTVNVSIAGTLPQFAEESLLSGVVAECPA